MATTLASSFATSPRATAAPALPFSLRAATSLWLLACLCACEQRAELPGLPGVTDESLVWFWRDVLAAPLPNESVPDSATLALSSPAARIDALAELVSQQHPSTLATAMALLRDENTGVACAAAEALGQLGNPGAIPRLLKGIGPYPVDFEPSIHVRAAEAAALAALGNPAGIPLILDLLAEDTDSEIDRSQLAWTETSRMVFVRELALPGLLALSGSDFGYIPNGTFAEREAAVFKARAWWDQHRGRLWAKAPLDGAAIVTRARLLVRHLDAYQLRQVDGARFALAHMGPPVLSHLQEGLQNENTYVRLHVLEVMERLCDLAEPKIRSRLAIVAAGPLLDDADLRVAAQAASVCAAAGMIDPLVAAMTRRQEPIVQLALVDALGRSGQSLAHKVLLDTFGAATG
ncbi:MAG: HEAT repeat protein, partial [Pseudohongiellaceae bacterium]